MSEYYEDRDLESISTYIKPAKEKKYKGKYVITSIKIPPEHRKLLEDRSINISKLIRKLLDKEIQTWK